MRFAASLLFLLAVPLLAFGQSDVRDKVVDGNSPVSQYNSGRMADLPTGEADKLYLTLTVSDDWQSDPRQRQVVAWFNTDPRLVKYKSQMRWNWYTTSNPLFIDRLQKSYGTNVPIVSMQKPNGDTLLNVTGISMPRTGAELADMVSDSLEVAYSPPTFEGQSNVTPIEREQCPDGNCPPSQPAVNPNDGAAPLIPEILPNKVLPTDPLVIGGIVLGVGVTGGLVTLLLALLFGIVAFRRPRAVQPPGLF